MKKANFLITLILIIVMLIPVSAVSAADNGVDDLRGRWDLQWNFNEQENESPLILYINDIRESYYENTYFAGGCMRSPGTDAFMPLSLRAVFNPDDNTYAVNLYSTVVPAEEFPEPYVISFSGTVMVNGNGVTDDDSNGTLETEFKDGEWSALHHDRRRTKCPSLNDFGQGFQGDVYAHTNLNSSDPGSRALYEGYSVIVSSGMRVEASDGSSFVVQEYTDIFSPDIDFVGRFRYLGNFDGLPVSGATYQFSLLDIFGDPIPGTESSDVWYGCNQGAPLNLSADYSPANPVLLSWDPVADVPGEFVPTAQVGFYQMGVFPAEWESASNFGASGIAASSHYIPWDPFEPGTSGLPDGGDFGVSLSEFEDGSYWINVGAFGVADPQGGGIGLECAVFNSEDDLLLTKAGENLTIHGFGNISGYVFAANGDPLGGIGVDIEKGGYGTCTDGNGFYQLANIPDGIYNIVAGREICGPHPFEEQVQPAIPTGSTNVDFYLNEMNQYNPTLHVVPAHPEIHGHEWNPGAPVTINVYKNDDFDNNLLYTKTKLVTDEPTWCGEPCFELPIAILPGYVVTMTDAEATRLVHTTSLVWTGTDEEAETVFGTADPGAMVEVTVHGPEWGQRMVQADEDGNWVADFSAPGPEDFEQDILDLSPGFHGRSIEFEGGVPDDGTLAYWHIEEPVLPNIIAQPDHEWVNSSGWAVGEEITLYVGDHANYLDGYTLSMTQTATPANWDSTVGQVWFDNWAPFDLAPGMFVTVTNGTITRILQVEEFSVDDYDEVLDTVSGTAPAGREVGVGVHQPGVDFWLVVTTDPTGQWFADFGVAGFDIYDVFDIHAMLWDEDGDATQANYNFP
jgi:hypothetical protein